MKLNYKQTIAFDFLEDNVTEEVFFGGAAGPGKTRLGCYWQLKRRFKYPGSRGFIGRAIFKSLKDTTLKTFFETAKDQGLIRGKHFDLTGSWDKESPNCIVFINGSLIFLRDLFQYPADPEFDELGSLEITDAFVDECGQVGEMAKTILKVRIRYQLDRWGLIPKILYASNPVKTWPYYEFFRPWKEGKLLKNRQFIPALVHDNPFSPLAYIESLKNMPEGPQKERLYRGNWEYSDDPSALIDYEKILDLFTNTFIANGGSFLTCDVARFGSDKTVIGVWSGYRCRLFAYNGLSVQETANKIKEFQSRYLVPNSNTIADEDGVGGGVVDILRCKGFVNNSRPLPNPVTNKDENYANLKSQCYFMLADKINKGGLYIECNDPTMKAEIIQELEQVKQYNMDKDGKRQIMPKDKVKEIIGRSPDYSDTLMMRLWFELAPKFEVVAF